MSEECRRTHAAPTPLANSASAFERGAMFEATVVLFNLVAGGGTEHSLGSLRPQLIYTRYVVKLEATLPSAVGGVIYLFSRPSFPAR